MFSTNKCLTTVSKTCPNKVFKKGFKKFKNTPKIFIGFSDITGLHIAFNQIANLITFHTPNPMYGLGSEKGLDPISELYFWSLIMNSDEYNYEIVVDKKYLPKRILELFNREPVKLAPWDPMGALAI